MKLDLSPQHAWQPLPPDQWNEDAARHLLRRVGWAAQPPEVVRLMHEGLALGIERLFPKKAPLLPKPELVSKLEEATPELNKKIRAAELPEDRQALQRELREMRQASLKDLTIRWLRFAARSENAVTEKWTLFLADIYVVSREKVDDTSHLYEHHDLLRRGALGPAPALTKAVSRSPAMVRYLDLQNSKKNAPNENFARELFELFVLGEGNYTERDIKEAARAFTGYRINQDAFHFAADQHDRGSKTVFGVPGRYDGDAVIDLAYEQPAAGRFVPAEMVKFYLSDTPLPPVYVSWLGDWWRSTGYDLRELAVRFFSSRLFHHPAFRGGYIKRPAQFYLGLVQDLNLDVAPYARHSLNTLRLMGEEPFRPPNVRGWVGGRRWINSGTLNARRQLVETLFTAVKEDKLNADERAQLAAARAEGLGAFTVTDARLANMLAHMTPDQITTRFLDYFLPVRVSESYRATVRSFLQGDASNKARRLSRLRNTAITLLQSPEYQLC